MGMQLLPSRADETLASALKTCGLTSFEDLEPAVDDAAVLVFVFEAPGGERLDAVGSVLQLRQPLLQVQLAEPAHHHLRGGRRRRADHMGTPLTGPPGLTTRSQPPQPAGRTPTQS